MAMQARVARPMVVTLASSLDLIHRSNSPNPASMRVCGRSGGNFWPPEEGESLVVLEVAFRLACKLAGGAYGPTR